MAKKKKKTKLLSKIDSIKNMIEWDSSHPGSITSQRYEKKGGKKTKKYYSWQSSFQGHKKSVRIPDEYVGTVEKLINAAKRKTKMKEKRAANEIKAYNRALDAVMKKNAMIRKKNGDTVGSNGEDGK